MADSIADPKLLGDYLEELINGWCPHEGTKGTQALKCLRCIGDALKEVQDQSRAEVLAACQGVVEVFIQEIGKFSQEFAKRRPFKQWNRDDWEAAGLRLLADVQDAFEKVQPAAADLEELLREARLKGLELANLIYESDTNFVLMSEKTRAGRMESYDVWNKIFAEAINIRVHEKEKARAEGKG